MTTDDIEASVKLHEELDCIVFVNEGMGVYFIEDPDGYWIEIIPAK
jgi:lactoylglutathione lyase and related lyases